jgi:peptidoglycan/LPS O-acetylase OafA/YrhL
VPAFPLENKYAVKHGFERNFTLLYIFTTIFTPRMSTTQAKDSRVHWIDSLRGIAAILVMVMHIWEVVHIKYPSAINVNLGAVLDFFISSYLSLGKVGVVIFFLVSGYVIPYSLRNRTLKSFVTSRIFRLYPAYWFSILLFTIIVGVPSVKQLIANITMFQKFVGEEDLIGVYWTLQIELIFYFICAALFYFKKLDNTTFIYKFVIWLLIITLGLAITRYITYKKLPVALPLGLAVMFLGLAIRDAHDAVSQINNKRIYNILICFIVFLLPICLLAYNRDYGFNEKWYKYFISYVFGIGLFFFFYYKNWQNSILLYFGRISYSLYLLHPIAALIIVPILVNSYPVLAQPTSFILIGILLSIIVATVSYYFIEEPFLKLGKKAMNRLKKPTKL